MIKIVNLKLGILLKNKNIKTFLKKFLILLKVKNTVLWTYGISDLNREEIVVAFYEKELQNTKQK